MILRSSRIPLLVLANLGLVPFVACKEETPVQDPTTLPPASASASTTADPTTSAMPTTSATPAASVAASASGSAALQAGECRTDADCGAPYKQCTMLLTVDKHAVGRCEPREGYHLGRPLVVSGEAHVASVARAPSLSRADVAALVDVAREEHASIAAFARTISELMALGAPTWLLGETQAALADEIRHTEMALDLVERASGERPVLGRLHAAVAPLRSGETAAADLVRDVFRGGAVGETLAAAHAEGEREGTADEALRAFYDATVRDESRHAALAFKTLRWLVATFPALESVLRQERTRFAEGASFEARALVTPLFEVLA